jgi:hypothetical protein
MGLGGFASGATSTCQDGHRMLPKHMPPRSKGKEDSDLSKIGVHPTSRMKLRLGKSSGKQGQISCASRITHLQHKYIVNYPPIPRAWRVLTSQKTKYVDMAYEGLEQMMLLGREVR